MSPRSHEPKPPAAPRAAITSQVGTLTADRVADDSVLLDSRVAAVDLADHECEFAEISSSVIEGGTLAASRWRKAVFADLELTEVDAANAVFDECDWHRTRWTRARLTGVQLSGCTLQDCEFVDCVMDLAAFRMATLRRVRFSGCRLTGLDAAHATGEHVVFEGCDLSDSQFHQARFANSAIRGSELAGLQGISSLAGVRVRPVDLVGFAAQLAAAVGIVLEE